MNPELREALAELVVAHDRVEYFASRRLTSRADLLDEANAQLIHGLAVDRVVKAAKEAGIR